MVYHLSKKLQTSNRMRLAAFNMIELFIFSF